MLQDKVGKECQSAEKLVVRPRRTLPSLYLNLKAMHPIVRFVSLIQSLHEWSYYYYISNCQKHNRQCALMRIRRSRVRSSLVHVQ